MHQWQCTDEGAPILGADLLLRKTDIKQVWLLPSGWRPWETNLILWEGRGLSWAPTLLPTVPWVRILLSNLLHQGGQFVAHTGTIRFLLFCSLSRAGGPRCTWFRHIVTSGSPSTLSACYLFTGENGTRVHDLCIMFQIKPSDPTASMTGFRKPVFSGQQRWPVSLLITLVDWR